MEFLSQYLVLWALYNLFRILIILQFPLNRLITYIKSTNDEQFTQRNIIFLARLFKAFTEICPNLKLCLTQTLLVTSAWDESKLTTNTAATNHLEHWDRMCGLLDEEATALWKRWLDLFASDLLKEHNGHCFDTNVNLITLLTIFPSWDTIVVEEKDEQNQSIESTIRIPNQPSIPLQDFLFKCCSRLNKTIPNTLPKAITALLNDCIVERLRLTYSEFLTANELIANNQNVSLQFYFDLKFLNLLLGCSGRRTAATTNVGSRDYENLATLANSYKAHIDPFDFEMFHKHINANVKKATQRMQYQFGLLVPNFEHLTTSSISTQTNAQDKEPNVLTLSAQAALTNLFPLLPIVIPTAPAAASAAITASPAKEEKVIKTEKVRQLNLKMKNILTQICSVSS